jgi:hypothetical protein
MLEQTPSLEQARTEVFIGKLPTDIDIAKQGVKCFQATVDRLPLKAKGIFLNSLDIQNCFIGTNPETRGDLDQFSAAQLSELSNILSQTAPDMLLLPHYDGDMVKSASLLNLKAVRRVIENYPEYFPEEAKTDIKSWLKENENEWFGGSQDIVEIRYGLLSGYPLTSVLRHCQPIITYEQDGDFSYVIHSSEKGFSVWGRACGGYCGYDEQRDLEYVASLDDLREQSGIDSIVETYEGTEAYLSYHLDRQRAQEAIAEIKSIVEVLTQKYPQFTKEELNYVITGSLALKLAIFGNSVVPASLTSDGSRVNYSVASSPPYFKHGFTPSDQLLSVLRPPKDIDILRGMDCFTHDQLQ